MQQQQQQQRQIEQEKLQQRRVLPKHPPSQPKKVSGDAGTPSSSQNMNAFSMATSSATSELVVLAKNYRSVKSFLPPSLSSSSKK
jgi:hypothetical protein